MSNKRIEKAAERIGCKVEELRRYSEEDPKWEVSPIEKHHSWEGLHSMIFYNWKDALEVLRTTARPEPCAVDCECRDPAWEGDD